MRLGDAEVLSAGAAALRRTFSITRQCAPPPKAGRVYLICMPEMAREMTSRWISEVPSKIV